jgi:hypothetical protein
MSGSSTQDGGPDVGEAVGSALGGGQFAYTPPSQPNAYGPTLPPVDAEQRAATADPSGTAARQRAWRKESYEFDKSKPSRP